MSEEDIELYEYNKGIVNYQVWLVHPYRKKYFYLETWQTREPGVTRRKRMSKIKCKLVKFDDGTEVF